MRSVLGVDVGGTFTDFLLWEDGHLTLYKRPTTPPDPAQGVLLGLEEAGARPGAVVHGSTIATNALIERKGAPTALVTTRGFADVLVIGRQTRPKLYDLHPRRPPPLVPDDWRLEADERLDATGQPLRPLDAEEAEALAEQALRLGAQSLAICFLFSFLNPAHERLVAEAARRRGLFVSPSFEVLPEHREYERTVTTVVNAYLSPVMARYLERLAAGLSERGVERLTVMGSSGGVMSPRAAGRLAVRTVLSGPAGGVVGAFWTARQAGLDHIITLDMGGTSTDVALCPGRVPERDETLVGELPVRGATVDVVSVGAGGGSLARLDEGGALRVGPESAGADPGPACYGRSLSPAVTDAQVVLGRILPEHFLGGRMTIYPERSREALAALASAFGGTTEAAAAVVRVTNANMERALRIVSVERGYDPRSFTLVAFGGAGPLHACELAQALRIPRVLVPRYPGVLSALGMVVARPGKEMRAAAMLLLPPEGGPSWEEASRLLESRFRELEEQGLAELREEGLPTEGLERERFLDLRYLGQSYELPISLEDTAPTSFLPRFHALHRERYGHSAPERPVQVVNLRLRLLLPGADLRMPQLPEAGPDPSPALLGQREVWFGRPLMASVYLRERLRAGNRLRGPAVVVQMDATTAVPPGWEARVDAWGNLLLEPR
jgi:N-methylhydantoinase A